MVKKFSQAVVSEISSQPIRTKRDKAVRANRFSHSSHSSLFPSLSTSYLSIPFRNQLLLKLQSIKTKTKTRWVCFVAVLLLSSPVASRSDFSSFFFCLSTLEWANCSSQFECCQTFGRDQVSVSLSTERLESLGQWHWNSNSIHPFLPSPLQSRLLDLSSVSL